MGVGKSKVQRSRPLLSMDRGESFIVEGFLTNPKLAFPHMYRTTLLAALELVMQHC